MTSRHDSVARGAHPTARARMSRARAASALCALAYRAATTPPSASAAARAFRSASDGVARTTTVRDLVASRSIASLRLATSSSSSSAASCTASSFSSVGHLAWRAFASSSAAAARATTTTTTTTTTATRVATAATRATARRVATASSTRGAATTTTTTTPAFVHPLVRGGAFAENAVAAWLAGGCVWVFSLVVLGGATRLTRSGLSMTDWKF
eukprot:31069-Pelagococcus_subviridis.AAC.1